MLSTVAYKTRWGLWNLQNRSFREERLWQWNFKVANKMVSFNWWKNSETHRDTPARQSGPLSQRAWLQLLPSSWQYRGQLLPPNNRLARCGEWRRTYVPRWQRSNSQHTHWCRSRDSRILRQKEQKSSFQIFSVPPRFLFFFFSTNMSLVRSLRCWVLLTKTTTACILLNIPLFLVHYGILAFVN